VQRTIVVNQFTATYLSKFSAEPQWCNRPLVPQRVVQNKNFYILCAWQLIVDTSNLVCRFIIASPSLHTTNCPWNGRGHVTWSSLNFKALNITQE